MKTVLAKGLLALLLIFGLHACKEKKEKAASGSASDTQVREDGFVTIFDGKTLDNWKGDSKYWRVENGNLVGELTPDTPLRQNTFLVWQGGQPGDFELKLQFKIAESGNSGINYRSALLADIPNALRGYQADIDGKITYTGQNYEERKRATLAYRGERAQILSRPDSVPSLGANLKRNAWQSRKVLESLGSSESLKDQIRFEDWNDCHLIIRGNTMKHYVNGVLMSEVIDEDKANRTFAGYLGLQVHVGPPMKVEYRDILLKEL